MDEAYTDPVSGLCAGTIPTREEERELIAMAQEPVTESTSPERAQQIKDAMDRLVLGHYRFICKTVWKLRRKFTAMPYEDLLQSAVCGFIAAIRRFELDRNLRLCTYAYYSMYGAMQNDNAHYHSITVRSDKVHITEQTNDKAHKARTVAMMSTLEGPLPDPRSRETADVLGAKDWSRHLRKWFRAVLEPRERIILANRFGLHGTPRTLQEIGDTFGLSRERVRQIEEIALEKLKRAAMLAAKNGKPAHGVDLVFEKVPTVSTMR